jgi:PAS domain-containing protein
MTFHDRRQESRPTTGEAPFGLEEVFFSRTDSRGIILTYNYVFRRVSNFQDDQLVGRPHKIIRHPDMPRGVFQLFWDTLKRGETIGAYVKNKAEDGLHYWVFAVVVPCGEGFLSARIKPSSKLFATIEQEYKTLLISETDEGVNPEESANLLLKRLQELGFDDYPSFASYALAEELVARDEGISLISGVNPPENKKITGFRNMLKNADDLVEETNNLVREFDAMRTIPHNLRVIASRIEPAGGPVTELSENYGTMSRKISEWFEAHVKGDDSNFSAIKGTVNNSMFLEGMAQILVECDVQLQKERRDLQSVDMEKERKILANTAAEQRELAQRGLADVIEEARRISSACSVMHRHFLGLSTIRVLCKIESARLSKEGEALNAIIDQLGVFQNRISKQLDRIANLSRSILAHG